MLFGLGDVSDNEITERGGGIVHRFHLKPERGELGRDLAERSVGVQMLLEPAQREFHRARPPVTLG